MEPGVRVHHADHRDIREIQPLRDHLSAEEDVHVPPRHALEDPVVRPLRARRVEVHPRDPRRRKPQTHEMLELLGAEPPHALGLVATLAAGARNRLLVPAVMAAEGGWRLVDRERDGAMGAGRHVAAVRSEEHTSELQSLAYLVCRLLLEKKKKKRKKVLTI